MLYVLDSSADAPEKVGHYDWIDFEHVEWFKKTSQQYKRSMTYPRDLLFQHIPLPEYWQARHEIVAGVNNETNDTISSPYINTGLFAQLWLNQQIGAVFVGHDHDNNFVGNHYGIQLCYGQVSGYNCYGDLARGARIIDLSENGMETMTVEQKDFKMLRRK